LQVDQKRDLTPVTDADRGAEEILRQRIHEAYPADGIFGEEFGEEPGRSGCRWIIDPIDGTKAFVRGVPLFGTLVALECQREPVMGVCHFPALGEVIYAARGAGAWWRLPSGETREARVSAVDKLARATVCYTEIAGWQATRRTKKLLRLCDICELARGWGDCYGHMMVATGRADIMVDPLLNPWDAAALIPIVREAGGHFLDWHGRLTDGAGNGISVNAALKDDLIALLNG